MVRLFGARLAVAVLLFWTLAVGSSQADLVYRFTGALPSTSPDGVYFELDNGTELGGGTTGLPELGPGATWSCFLTIDDSQPNQGNEFTGEFYSVVKQFVLEFSNGYQLSIDSTAVPSLNGAILIDNDLGWDGINASITFNVGLGQSSLNLTVIDESQGALSSTDLPGIGTTLAHNSTVDPNGDNVFDFMLAGGGGLVSYYSKGGELFEVVPEPSTLALWCIAAVGLAGTWWRKRRVK
jgi:hypothetical protein